MHKAADMLNDTNLLRFSINKSDRLAFDLFIAVRTYRTYGTLDI